ncbi:MAG: tRNA 5-methylaminomethyl-2-thiouridine biosynthesis bifunctional protein [Halieaceae bacterium]|jgi:tRNA 5-methylaminomethyl-2-thiouridine biosynthesis bifunctional protein
MSNTEKSLLSILPGPELEWSESGEPRSQRFNDLYFCSGVGVAESNYVFLSNNYLPARWKKPRPKPFTIAETGFGTGLNFLLSWQNWRENAPTDSLLHYLSVEQYPLSSEELQRCVKLWPEVTDLSQQLIAQYPQRIQGMHRLLFDEGRVVLDLCFASAEEAINSYWREVEDGVSIDAWFLDGFSPRKNPSLWTESLFGSIAGISSPETTLATYSAAGSVRRGLQKHGFEIEIAPGFGSKQDMLRGRFVGLATDKPAPSTPSWSVPWHRGSHHLPRGKVLIIGSGLAGCTTAAALARRGWKVTMLEAKPEIAQGASGNRQAVLYTRLSHQYSPLAEFSLRSYLFALSFYQNMFRLQALATPVDGEFCGSIHLNDNSDPKLLSQLLAHPTLSRPVDPADAAALSGLSECPGGLYFPGSGWLSPQAICAALLDNVNIELLCGVGECGLTFKGGSWVAADDTGEMLASADAAVICTGTSAIAQPECDWLPFRAIRGQVTHLPATTSSRKLRSVLCHEGYLAPAKLDVHCAGATFDLDSADAEVRTEGHLQNLAQLGRSLPSLAENLSVSDPSLLGGKTGFRCSSPDYLPAVGPVPKMDAFLRNYRPLGKDAKKSIPQPGEYHPGLYVNSGHGSRGLTSTPLSAELIASLLCGEHPPVSVAQQRALAPARFLIRDIIRKRR